MKLILPVIFIGICLITVVSVGCGKVRSYDNPIDPACSASDEDKEAKKDPCKERGSATSETTTPAVRVISDDGRFELVGITVVGDENSDGLVNPGEKGYLKIEVKNLTDTTIKGLTGTVSSSDSDFILSYYNNSASKLFFGDISSGASACGSGMNHGDCSDYSSYYLAYIASEENNIGPTSLTLVLNSGSTLPLTIDIQRPVSTFTVASVTIVGDANSDGILNPGETGYLKIEITNGGSAKVLDVTGTVTSADSGIDLSYYNNSAGKLFFGGISAGASACGSGMNHGDCSDYSSYYLK